MKWKILELLENHSGEFISGENIASSLGITRAAVWKSVKSLQNEGYKIQAVKNRGYSLLLPEQNRETSFSKFKNHRHNLFRLC